MLEAILVRNFQRFNWKFRIEFDKRITVIVGRSDLGKSTLVRALRWCTLNKGPKKVHSHGTDNTRVTIWIDGHKLSRVKSPRLNKYILDGQEYKALKKSGMPDQVAALLRMDEQNFQRQLDAHFWFSLSPAAVSAELNKLINLGQIDTAIYHSHSSVKKLKTKIEVTEEALQDTRRRIKKLKWIEKLEQDMKVLEKLESRIERRSARIDSLALCIERAVKARQAQLHGSTAQADASKLEKRFKRLSKLNRKIENLEEVILELQSCQAKLEQNQKSLSNVKTEIKKLGNTCPTCGQQLEK